MTATPETFIEAWIADLKSHPEITSLLCAPNEIREVEWQGTDFCYANIRVAITFRPSINRCGPDDADIELEIFSEEKSSKQATHIASVIVGLYHGHTFEMNGIKFSTVIVREVTKPERSIYAWMVKVKIFSQGV